jgi:hypothetical protein
MPFVVKAALAGDPAAPLLSFTEKAMYEGRKIRAGDEIFVFASDHQGGQGLCARGVVTSVGRAPRARWVIDVRPLATARRRLGRTELKPFRDLDDAQPQAEIARKLYREATNKIAGVTEPGAAFLRTFF